MRRSATICLLLGALALPATALAFSATASDGTLVVKSGSAPAKVAVVTLVISGTAIGHVSTGSPDQFDTVVIVDAKNTGAVAASATGSASLVKTSGPDLLTSGTRTKLVGSDFRFRAADGLYKITIYGSGVDLFAVGKGQVVLQGQTDPTVSDGRYSVDGGDWHSLPAQASDWLPIPAAG
jgi:hypothetical protein